MNSGSDKKRRERETDLTGGCVAMALKKSSFVDGPCLDFFPLLSLPCGFTAARFLMRLWQKKTFLLVSDAGKEN